MNGNRTGSIVRFAVALCGLALEPEEQLSLFPIAVQTADELVLDHEEAQSLVRTSPGNGALTPEQDAALARLDAHIVWMSDKGDPTLWTDEAIRSSADWQQLRVLARAALELLDWQDLALEPPVAVTYITKTEGGRTEVWRRRK